MMPAIADQSTVDLFGWKGWLILALVAIAVLVAPHLFDRDPEPTRTTCDACPEPAAVQLSVGHEWVHLCEGHGIPLLTEGMNR